MIEEWPCREDKRNATTSVLTLRGHREDELAERVAARVASRMETTVCVACGIHVEAIRPEELTEVLAMAEDLTEHLLERLRDQSG